MVFVTARLWYLNRASGGRMHGAFDVGLQNKRLTLFADKLGAGRHDTPAAGRHDKPMKGGVGPPEPPHEASASAVSVARWATVFAVYLALVVSDYLVLPSAHGAKLALAIITGTPLVLLHMHLQRDATEAVAAVTAAHLVVTVQFAADPERMRRELVPVSTMLLVAAGVCQHGWRRRHLTDSLAVMCAGGAAYVLALAVLVATQALELMAGRILLPLQQAFVLLSVAVVALQSWGMRK
jgi:hypothetical protein